MPLAQYRNALKAGTVLHEYRVEQVLGAGGFGMTYLARDTHLEKQVAIKEYLPSELAQRAPDGTVQAISTEREGDYRWGLDRFLQEARTLAKFSHPNIVRVLRYFEGNATAYMVMEYESGEPLKTWLVTNPQPKEEELRRMLGPLLDGLAAVHRAGFLHRDIKPDNIFLRADGAPVLIDFGATRNAMGGETRALTAVLTPGFAPLEQYSGEGRQGPWTDLYALGGVLYRAISGQNPPDAVTRLKADPVAQALAAARSRFDAAFLSAIEWALKLDEKARPQSVAEWRERLFSSKAVAQHTARQALATPPSPARKRRRWIGYALGALAVAAFGAVLLRVAQKPDRPAPMPAQVTAAPGAPSADEKLQQVRRQLLADFKAADSNHDGYLSPEEVRERFPGIARNFMLADEDRDGRISPQEYLRFRRLQAERRLGKHGD